jgi:leucyl aminopeptidase
VTLVGKGVTFDTGGLDIKPSSEHAADEEGHGRRGERLGLAHMIIDAKLKVRLRVLIPIVENAISGNAFRPGDVLTARNGTDGRDRQHRCRGPADPRRCAGAGRRGEPELLIDMATLTGAARVALGPDLPPLYTADDALAADLMAAGAASDDPLWRLPLWAPYESMISSRIAEVNNAGGPLPARSPPRCSSSASSGRRRPGRISTSTAGRPKHAPRPALWRHRSGHPRRLRRSEAAI